MADAVRRIVAAEPPLQLKQSKRRDLSNPSYLLTTIHNTLKSMFYTTANSEVLPKAALLLECRRH